MSEAILEHVNVTVPDPDRTAKRLCELFGWRVRWKGDSIDEGYSVHVGGETSYLALYRPKAPLTKAVTPQDGSSYRTRGGLNHIAVVVDDLDAAEARMKAAGIETRAHADYEPGRRFYAIDEDGVDYEVVSYAMADAAWT